jgi:predicted nucleotidyltransferase
MGRIFEEIKRKAVPVLKANEVEFAGLFGSYARGDAGEESDVDLLIKFATPKTLLDLIHLENTLSEQLNRKVDLVTEGALSPYIKDSVLNDLKILYGKR